MAEKDMEALQTQALSIKKSYQTKALELQVLQTQEAELMKTLAEV